MCFTVVCKEGVMGVSVSVEADRDRIMRAFHANDVKIEEMMLWLVQQILVIQLGLKLK